MPFGLACISVLPTARTLFALSPPPTPGLHRKSHLLPLARGQLLPPAISTPNPTHFFNPSRKRGVGRERQSTGTVCFPLLLVSHSCWLPHTRPHLPPGRLPPAAATPNPAQLCRCLLLLPAAAPLQPAHFLPLPAVPSSTSSVTHSSAAF